MHSKLSVKCLFAIRSADAYFALAAPTTNRIAVGDLNNWPSILEDSAASATLLSLSLELYLKCLMLKLGFKLKRIHELDGLFSMLPLEAQERVNAHYERHQTPLSQTQNVEYRIAIPNENENEHAEPFWPSEDETTDIKSVLSRCKNAFVTWRYLYQKIDDTDGYSIHRYEFHRMISACKSLRDHILES
jgi:HEPN domain-containing protein